MNQNLQQSEVVILQVQIITWFQKQILDRQKKSEGIKELMDFLGQALNYYQIIINLEEKTVKDDDNQSVVPSPRTKALAKALPNSQPIFEAEVTSSEDNSSTESNGIFSEKRFFSLAQAHAAAQQDGCTMTVIAFRDELRRGGTIMGWRKISKTGNKPSYFRE